ncbi:class I SAM-dependent methyltransferase [Gorillibacterium timonense]|uniref:class I SAM-dependent methyltransferase n=1 Tax=Gorillibacterium timonense TaxID=1689269 RepID=UPI00071DC399|nr:class I SAM-dependent methyltransferase [Gorillibacterium timonense]
MNIENLNEYWKAEETQAHIRGWDFSPINGRYTEESDLPWDYESILRSYLKETDALLDMDTGGGEFLLSLNHPHQRTHATEAYPPNVQLCRDVLLPLGIDFREACSDADLPFDDEEFDVVINRHGSYAIPELDRILKPGGLFITQQVGENNDREFVDLLLPEAPKPFHGLNLSEQRARFHEAGFTLLKAEEAFRPIRFFDVGALVWFARIIEWEFPGFSVDACFERLLQAHQIVEANGFMEGTIHRYLIVAQKWF